MATRFTMGKPGWRARFLRLQWGVRASLFAAFAVIAGMGLVISAGAGMVLGHLGERMVDLSARDIPRLAASLQLSAQSASLASQGPALLASRSEEVLNERTKKIKETQAVAFDKLGEVIELGADKAVVAALTETVKNFDDNIKSLVAAARERLEIAAASAAIRCAAQRAGGLRCRRHPCDAGRPNPDQRHPRLRHAFPG
jgi:phosphoglycerate-specific signal transduction histidine kinase